MRSLVVTLSTILVAALCGVAAPVAGGEPPGTRDLTAAAQPGLVSVYFLSANFTRPNEVTRHPQVNHDTGTTINDYSQLWLGALQVPTGEELTLSAEADNGCRLILDGKPVIDGWSSPVREGKVVAHTGQRLALRVEFFQNGGTAHLRLYWSWRGQPRALIPASAFSHTAEDERAAQDFLGGKHRVATGASADAASFQNRAVIYGTPEDAASNVRPAEPLALGPGPHLFLDEYLIESAEGVTRKVFSPPRDPGLPNPLITGPEDRCFQPYFTVSRSPETGKYRLWYGAWGDGQSMSRSHLAYLESDDGLRWQRPAKILKDPAEIQFGSEVLDEGPDFPDPARRYKYSWWHGGGLRIATSPDGLEFTPLSPAVVLPHGHDITNIWRDPLRNRYVATVSEMLQLEHMGESRRTTLQAVSDDLLHWSPKWIVLAADNRYDPDVLQFYAMNGYLVRGGLVIGMVKNLHDDWGAEGRPPGAFGIGSTSLAWTRDGQTWIRDRAVFFGPDPQAGTWDHAHAWIDEQLPVNDEVYLYYGGYKWGHKHNRFAERQIGVVTMRRDRYVAREAGAAAGTLRTPLVLLDGSALTINAQIGGELKVRLVDAQGQPLTGFDWVRLQGDDVQHSVAFAGKLASLAGQPVRLEFQLRQAQLFGFDLRP